ncbi:MAG: adenylate kinase [Acidimicrobiaceae bacterium]|nr:adenylate kinase [Acidimicrobiaceae bacterium]
MTLGMVILGRQGSGKGTQAVHIAKRFEVVHISTGDMLRSAVEEGTELGLQAKSIMDAGGLVTDDVVNGIVAERLAKEDVRSSGFLLDGYPRTVGQASVLKQLVEGNLKLAINLDVSIEEVTQRMISRGREDDTPEAIARRLELYESETSPLIQWFDDEGILCVINGLGTESEVHKRVIDEIEKNL